MTFCSTDLPDLYTLSFEKRFPPRFLEGAGAYLLRETDASVEAVCGLAIGRSRT